MAALPGSGDWLVTPESATLHQHWRHHPFVSIRPFFCRVEAVDTAIWLTEVAAKRSGGKKFLEHLANANAEANPELRPLALKLATGARKTTVMAMLIVWQTINAVCRPGSHQFTRGFALNLRRLRRSARTSGQSGAAHERLNRQRRQIGFRPGSGVSRSLP